MFTAKQQTKAVQSNLRNFPEFLAKVAATRRLKMKDRQEPLYARYKSEPDAAKIVDGARTSCNTVSTDSPIYSEINLA